MDLETRIRRRRRTTRDQELVVDYRALSPIEHPDEPTGRGPVLERLLDHFEPIFQGQLPPNGYVHGPSGAGKSAVVTALFSQLERLSTETRSVIHTSTREATPTTPGFIYLDTRRASSEFAFYHRVLDALLEDPVPEHGISTGEVRDRLDDRLQRSRAGVVIAVDHADEVVGTEALIERFAGLPSNVSWLAIGRSAPESTALTEYTGTAVPVARCGRRTLVDVVTARASAGLAQGSLRHELARRIAAEAAGDAHDALAALFIAADLATRRDAEQLAESDIESAFAELPDDGASLAQVMALAPNRLTVLRELVDLDPAQRASVTAAAEAIGEAPGVALSTETVRRFLYELAEQGVVARVEATASDGSGRPPSRVEPRFPPTAFRRLLELRD